MRLRVPSIVSSSFQLVTGSGGNVVWKWIYDPLSGILNLYWNLTHYQPKHIFLLVACPTVGLMAIIIILLTTQLGQPIILLHRCYGNIDTPRRKPRVDGATEFRFLRIKCQAYLPTTFILRSLRPLTFSMFRLDPIVDIRWSELPTSTLMYYLYEKAQTPLNVYANNYVGVFLAVMLIAINFAQSTSRKWRRILKKGASDETNTKKPITAFTVISTIALPF